MSMLRKEWEVNAIAVLVRAKEQADLFEDAAAHFADEHPHAAALSHDLAARRRQLARDLAVALKGHHIFPKDVDPEREAADHVIDTVAAALSRHEAENLMRHRLHSDETLRGALDEALGTDGMPDDIRTLLTDFADRLGKDDARIDAWLKAHDGQRGEA